MKINSQEPAPIPIPSTAIPMTPAAVATPASPTASSSNTPPSKDTAKVAQEFESIFLRKMLAGLEKTTSMGGHAPGADMYGQMITDAFADSMTKAGGIGLAKSIEEHLTGKKP